MSFIHNRLATLLKRLLEDRGDSLVNWVVLAVGLAAAAALVVALLKPAIQTAGERIVTIIGGG